MTEPHDDAGAVLRATGIRVALSGRTVLDGVELRVAPGEFVGLIGANGAGKTTLLKVLLGVLRPTAGAIHRPPRGRAGGIGYVPQHVSIDPDTPLRTRDVVALGLDGGRAGIPFRGRRVWEHVDRALRAVDAEGFATQPIGELSGGQQQRALLAHALVGDPALLLLDEPLASLDPASTHDIVMLLDRLRRSRDVAIIMTAHDLNVLLPAVDRIVYVAAGRTVSGTPDQVMRGDVLSLLYGRPIRVVHAGGQAVVVADEPEPDDGGGGASGAPTRPGAGAFLGGDDGAHHDADRAVRVDPR